MALLFMELAIKPVLIAKSTSKQVGKNLGGSKYFDYTTPFFVKSNILKLSEIYQLEVAKLLFQHTHHNIQSSFSTFFKKTSSVHSRIKRLSANNLNFYIPRFKYVKLQNSFKYQGVKIWNSKPNHLKQRMSFNPFKKQLKNKNSNSKRIKTIKT